MPRRGNERDGPRSDDEFSFAKRMLQGLKRQEEPAGESTAEAGDSATSEDVLAQLVSALKGGPTKISAVEPPGYGYLLRVRDHGESLGPSARGDAVEALQLALRKVGLEVPDSGRFDEATEAAVCRFQASRSLPETGTFELATFEALHTALGLDVAPKAPVPEAAPRSGSGASALPTTGNAYLDALAPGAVRGMHESGVPASVLLAMAVVESDWGEALLARDYHNVFGLPGTGPAGSVLMSQGSGGALEPAGTGTRYRHYDDIAQAVADFARVFAEATDYAGVMTHRAHAENFARALTGAYSQNPQYGSLIVRIMGQFDLRRYDRVPPRHEGW